MQEKTEEINKELSSISDYLSSMPLSQSYKKLWQEKIYSHQKKVDSRCNRKRKVFERTYADHINLLDGLDHSFAREF